MGFLLNQITAVVREILRDETIFLAPETRFEDIVNWDLMDLVSVVVEMECRFNLSFELPEIDRIFTVDDLMMMITAKQALASV